MAFLKHYAILECEEIIVLHPFFYLIKEANLNFKMHFRKCFFYGKVSYGVEIYETYCDGKA